MTGQCHWLSDVLSCVFYLTGGLFHQEVTASTCKKNTSNNRLLYMEQGTSTSAGIWVILTLTRILILENRLQVTKQNLEIWVGPMKAFDPVFSIPCFG